MMRLVKIDLIKAKVNNTGLITQNTNQRQAAFSYFVLLTFILPLKIFHFLQCFCVIPLYVMMTETLQNIYCVKGIMK